MSVPRKQHLENSEISQPYNHMLIISPYYILNHLPKENPKLNDTLIQLYTVWMNIVQVQCVLSVLALVILRAIIINVSWSHICNAPKKLRIFLSYWKFSPFSWKWRHKKIWPHFVRTSRLTFFVTLLI
jgi:hypothetical protein